MSVISIPVLDEMLVYSNPALWVDNHVYRSYYESKMKNLSLLNFSECIFTYEVDSIVSCLRKLKIVNFTISSSFSGMPELLYRFKKFGCDVVDTVAIKIVNRWNKESIIYAVKMRIKYK